LGGALGIVGAIWLAPAWAGIRVAPLADVAFVAIAAAVAVALAAAWWPARLAARLDPCVCFKEV
jgi:putative ABC transport system permease protein